MPVTDSIQPSTFLERDDWMRAVCASDLPHPAVRVAVRIGLHLYVKSGQCNPGIDTIATGTKLSERSVYRQIVLLERAGWVAIQRGGRGQGQRNQFTLVFPDKALSGKDAVYPDRAGTFTLTEGALYPDSTVAGHKQRNSEENSVANAQAFATREREQPRSLAGALPPDGGAPEDKFAVLLSIYDRPYGEDRAAAWTAYIEIYTPDIADEIEASARRWGAARPPEKLQPLEKWLRNGAWKKLPPSPTPKRGQRAASLGEKIIAKYGDRS
jgi:helix-turn-helix protein